MDSQQFSKLLQPIQIGSVQIKNRIALAPMGNFRLTNADGSLSQRHEVLRQRALS